LVLTRWLAHFEAERGNYRDALAIAKGTRVGMGTVVLKRQRRFSATILTEGYKKHLAITGLAGMQLCRPERKKPEKEAI
jgi:hypothetical protein